MGICGSKSAGADTVPPRPVTVSGAKTRPATGAGRNAPPSRSRQGGPSRPPTGRSRQNTSGGTRTHTRQRPDGSRPSSRQHPSSSRQHTSSGKHGRGHAPQRDHPRPIPEEVPPTQDSEIYHEVSTLNTMVDQHVQNFYQGNSVTIRREIGGRIIKDIIMGGADTESLINPLTYILSVYPTVPGRDDARVRHLLQLCKLGERIREMIRRYPGEWSFEEEWGAGVVFPGLIKGERVVVPREYG
ncbi:MAG: hypothetical protein M1840_002586 [Geoglossum simile]|nr:MAG: hypothetical protein M1840_002586 [Geoglossum simile]